VPPDPAVPVHAVEAGPTAVVNKAIAIARRTVRLESVKRLNGDLPSFTWCVS
jgi:hypothetical protein